MTCGIYKITSPSGKIYIGQTVDIERRFSEYRRKGSAKKQRRLFNSFAKYGVDSHIFEIVCECPPSDLTRLEREWQQTLDVCGAAGLNCRIVNTEDRAGEFSADSRKRMSAAQRGDNNPNFGKRGDETSCYGRKRPESERKAISEFQRQKGQIIMQIDKETGHVIRRARSWEYVADGFSQGNISSCCSGRLKSYKGFKFSYEVVAP